MKNFISGAVFKFHFQGPQGYNYDSPSGNDSGLPGQNDFNNGPGGNDNGEESYPGRDGSQGIDISNPSAGNTGYPRGGPAGNPNVPQGGTDGYPQGGPPQGGNNLINNDNGYPRGGPGGQDPSENGYPRGGPNQGQGNPQNQLPGGDSGYPRDVPSNRGSGY